MFCVIVSVLVCTTVCGYYLVSLQQLLEEKHQAFETKKEVLLYFNLSRNIAELFEISMPFINKVLLSSSPC